MTKILIPYVTKKIDDLKLRRNQKWLLISDVFKAQWTDQIKDLVLSSSGRMVHVPDQGYQGKFKYNSKTAYNQRMSKLA